ncbi:MAG TPA: rod shape-determining protein RodA [Candidatus Paceibacterota bacterium]
MNRLRFFMNGIDWMAVLVTLPILGAGLITMSSFSSENYFFSRQIIWILVALIIFFIASTIDWRFLRRTNAVVILYVASFLVLSALFIFSTAIKGAQSWFSLGLFAVQPVDLVKLILVITLAKYFSRRHIEIANYRHIVVSGLYALILFAVVALQPDFGSAIIIFLIWFGMVLVSGISLKHLAVVLGGGVVAFGILWFFIFAPYQKERILTFIDPTRDIRGSGYNAFQSMIAVGSGGLTGKGVGYGTQSRLEFLPEYETDFIFAAFAEEWGFVGSVLLFTFLGIVIWRIIAISARGSTNFETFFGIGVAVIIMAHFIVNVGMNIGILPVTGVTLPFMSYGGSHLVTEFLALGMVMGMRRYARPTHADVSSQELLGPA